jgi:hypothetical protein
MSMALPSGFSQWTFNTDLPPENQSKYSKPCFCLGSEGGTHGQTAGHRVTDRAAGRQKRARDSEPFLCVPCSITHWEVEVLSYSNASRGMQPRCRVSAARRDLKCAEAEVQAEAKANRRWPSTSTTRHRNGEVTSRSIRAADTRATAAEVFDGLGVKNLRTEEGGNDSILWRVNGGIHVTLVHSVPSS